MKLLALSIVTSFILKTGTAHSNSALSAGSLSTKYGILKPREVGTDCGVGYGSCSPGQCCSEVGWCGTTEDYCDGASCQLDYSDSCDTFSKPGGLSTESVARPKVGNVPYGSIITKCSKSGVIALTFDDGPYIYTSAILDVLDSYQVKATFFVTGNNLGKGHIDDQSKPWPGILNRMYSSGHQIASHTWTHRDLDQVNKTIQRTEMIYNEMAFRNLFGWFPTYMRPPYLDCSSNTGCLGLLNTLGYHIITTNLDTKDYENDSPDLIQESKDTFSSIVSGNPTGKSYIPLAHDVHEQTVKNLTAYMITTAQTRGYKLVTVGDCLGDPKENWYRTATGGAPSSSTIIPPVSTTSIGSSPGVTISPNQLCGGTTGYTCKGSAFGNCCSFYGYCGKTDSYCGTGCNNNFGDCNSGSGSLSNTTNGLCGPTYKSTCAFYGLKTCCSQFGYCGNTAAYCGTGCQKDYGTCT
ncbi:hypothetical protein BGZ63DRAFT_365704 [Mariannaea sp. PMI_226]|nr:hypothetical protein BGZ63DRAFT_365704 [Mariannaea sp. PMI_226]